MLESKYSMLKHEKLKKEIVKQTENVFTVFQDFFKKAGFTVDGSENKMSAYYKDFEVNLQQVDETGWILEATDYEPLEITFTWPDRSIRSYVAAEKTEEDRTISLLKQQIEGVKRDIENLDKVNPVFIVKNLNGIGKTIVKAKDFTGVLQSLFQL